MVAATATATLSNEFRGLAADPIVANACSVDAYNTCDSNANCSDTGLPYPQVSCTCHFGYTDTNPASPGTECQDQCFPAPNAPYCLNSATCVPTASSKPDCQCNQWYLGSRCENLNAGLVAAV